MGNSPHLDSRNSRRKSQFAGERLDEGRILGRFVAERMVQVAHDHIESGGYQCAKQGDRVGAPRDGSDHPVRLRCEPFERRTDLLLYMHNDIMTGATAAPDFRGWCPLPGISGMGRRGYTHP